MPLHCSSAQLDHACHCFPRGERMGRFIRTERHRLVEWKVPGAKASTADLELYDYQNDPAETKNLAAAEPQTVAQLQTILARHPEVKPPQAVSSSGGRYFLKDIHGDKEASAMLQRPYRAPWDAELKAVLS